MKTKLLVCAFILACLALAAYSTSAYFTYEDTATNVITMGNIKIELQQLRDGYPIDPNEVIDILPGTEIEKTVQVKNVGDNPAWIRIGVSEVIELTGGTLSNAKPGLIGYDINTENWTEKDGYYYYNEIVEAGQTTKSLFTEIRFAEQMGNEYQQSKAHITVSAQATQVANNGETVWDAVGWPSAE